MGDLGLEDDDSTDSRWVILKMLMLSNKVTRTMEVQLRCYVCVQFFDGVWFGVG